MIIKSIELMKSLILLISISVGAVTTNTNNHIEVKNKSQTVKAIFDAYEGDMYFFTNVETEEALTLTVEDRTVTEDFQLEKGENIGETFRIILDKNSKKPIIKSLEILTSNE